MLHYIVMKLRLPSRLEHLAFNTGFVLMAFELAAARILAPTIGSSTYIWTSVIGVIIAALSLGYYLGGRMADLRKKQSDVAWLLIGTAGLVAVAVLMYPLFLPWLAQAGFDSRLQAVVASGVLFAPASFLLGMVSPYLAKLNVTSLKTSGSAVANLSAWNSIGGIVGTFATGFFLFSYVGSRDIFIILVIILLVSTLYLHVAWRRSHWIAAAASLYLVIFAPTFTNAIQIDTPSANYSVFEWMRDGKRLRGLSTDPYGVQSGINTKDPDELVFWYAQQMADLIAQTPKKQDILMLGGGTFTLPRYLSDTYPQSQIDTVEIDPALADIARKHFAYDDPDNVNLIFEDARTYSNRADKQYDIILVDVYSGTDVPFAFMTREYGQAISRMLRPGGVVMVNMIAGELGDCRGLLQALEAPYRQVFSQHLLKPRSVKPVDAAHNMVGVYGDNLPQYLGYKESSVARVAPFTDDFAPAEYTRQKCAA